MSEPSPASSKKTTSALVIVIIILLCVITVLLYMLVERRETTTVQVNANTGQQPPPELKSNEQQKAVAQASVTVTPTPQGTTPTPEATATPTITPTIAPTKEIATELPIRVRVSNSRIDEGAPAEEERKLAKEARDFAVNFINPKVKKCKLVENGKVRDGYFILVKDDSLGTGLFEIYQPIFTLEIRVYSPDEVVYKNGSRMYMRMEFDYEAARLYTNGAWTPYLGISPFSAGQRESVTHWPPVVRLLPWKEVAMKKNRDDKDIKFEPHPDPSDLENLNNPHPITAYDRWTQNVVPIPNCDYIKEMLQAPAATRTP